MEMASLCLEPPASFQFSHPVEWPYTIEEVFLTISTSLRPFSREDVQQISALIYCMGDEAEDMLAFINISEDDRN